MSRMKFMNTEIDNVTMEEALVEIDRLIQKCQNAYVVTPNVDHIVQLEKDVVLQKVYQNASLILTDGQPLIWLSKLYKTPIVEKVSGSDLFPELCKMAAQKQYRMFFLGAAEGIAVTAAKNLKKRYPGLIVSGTYSPPMGFEKDQKEIKKIINMVREAKPHILIVGLGCPKQEKFMFCYHDKLQVPISLGLGASLDFEAGNAKRAPKWMSKMGLEWFYRMMQNPKRMGKRYFNDFKIIKLYFRYK